MSYKKLEVWKLARDLVIDIHTMTLTRLPKFELYESGQQIRRSSKSIRANIAEGYGRKHYKAEWEKFLIYAMASNDETRDHLETLFETGSLTDEELYRKLHAKVEFLGTKLYWFLQSVMEKHQSPK